MSAETFFKISVSEDQLKFLHKKLELTNFPDELDCAGWDYGVPLSDIRRLVAYWKDGYDWRKHEAMLNKLPQYTRDIEIHEHGTLNIHYVHQKSEVSNAIPLLFVHGWPGSFAEVSKMLPLLTMASADHPSFHIVAFSLPGFGFSEAPKKRGFATRQYAEVGNKLMLALGYNEYVTQGGDWGARITRQMAFTYGKKHVKAWHLNFPFLHSPPTLLQAPLSHLSNALGMASPRERAGFERMEWFEKRGRGYSHEQSTQPQTLGYSLSDSPVGLLAWIYEKLVLWTDAYPWTDDEVLTWISMYFFSRCGPAASLRIYYEVRGGGLNPEAPVPNSSIPLGLSHFPKEVRSYPRSWTQRLGNVVQNVEHAKGGHFAAHECPKELAGDLRNMFRNGGPAFGVVSGRSGYDTPLKTRL